MANRDLEQVGDPEIPQIIQIQIVPALIPGRWRSLSRPLLKLREYGVKLASLMGPGIALGVELDRSAPSAGMRSICEGPGP